MYILNDNCKQHCDEQAVSHSNAGEFGNSIRIIYTDYSNLKIPYSITEEH